MGRMVHSRTTAALALGAMIFATVVAVIGAAAPAGAASTFSNPGSITINDSNAPPTKATPYPSGIAVSGLTGTIAKVTVTLSGLSHTSASDIDAMVVSPSGSDLELMRNVGGENAASNVTLTFDDAAASFLPTSTALTSGTFKPTNNGVGNGSFPAPAPVPTGATTLATFNGLDPNGTWQLYVVDDVFGDSGTISGGWSLSVTTQAATLSSISVAPVSPSVTLGGSQQFTATGHYSDSSTADLTDSVTWASGTPAVATITATGLATGFTVGTSAITAQLDGVTGTGSLAVNAQSGTTNENGITINDSASPPTLASPYPSPILISGLTNPVSHVSVTLTGLTHTSTSDIDAMLVGPSGQNVILMNNAGSSATDATLTFDDGAASTLPATGTLVTGTYKPTNDGTSEDFPAPAPTPSGGTALSAFDNTSGNGYWELYMDDNVFGDSGSIASWTLSLTTATGTLASIAVTPTTPSLTPGGYQQMAATGTLTDSTTTDLTDSATWASSDPSVATVTPSGKVLALATGTTSISATQGGVEGSTLLTVSANPNGQNPNPITINDDTTASPYPSTISVSGLHSTLADVSVTLDGVTHTSPSDINVLLVGPGGQNIVLMGNDGGGNPISGVDLTFTDATDVSLPASATIASGSYRPTNRGTGDPFAAPAPTPSTATTFVNFVGTDPNGVWKLYVVDDSAGDSGVISGGWSLDITPPALDSIAVTPADPSINKGTTQQFTATGTYADDSTEDLTSQVTWGSDTPGTATITSGGLADGVGGGTSTISAGLAGVTGSTVLTVVAPTLESIAVTPANPSVAKGLTQQFTATGTYSDDSTADLTALVTWNSNTSSTATITDDGLASAVDTGTSTISATLDGVRGSTVLTVSPATLQSIAVTPANPSIAKGLTQQFTATGTYSDDSTANLTALVTWVSGTPSTASITGGGLATGQGLGTSTISATLDGVTDSTVLTVTAATLQSIAVTPANPTIVQTTTQQFTATGTYSDNSTVNLTALVAWSSGTPGTASITPGAGGGLATGLNPGSSTISAELGGVTGSTVLTVIADTSLHGIVRDSVFDAPVSGVSVRVWAVGASAPAAVTTTTTDGTYSFSNLPTGTYQVQFAKSLSYLTSWDSEAPLRSGAAPLALGPNSGVIIDQTLTIGVTIAGQVTDSVTHAGLGQVTVLALTAGTPTIVASTVTDGAGNYTFGKFPYRSYDIEYIRLGYVVQFWNGSADQANATPIVVSSTSGSPTANAALIASAVNTGSVSGTVTDSNTANPVAGVNVRLWRKNTQSYLSVTTNALGQYTIANVPPGTYELQFAKSGSYQTRWYGNVPTRTGATDIGIGPGSTIAADQTIVHV